MFLGAKAQDRVGEAIAAYQAAFETLRSLRAELTIAILLFHATACVTRRSTPAIEPSPCKQAAKQ
ncbi:MAG: hypothetical protein F6K28_51255 [Microcoleus sp. SIO2G3]|nr:hypothetical protein [Microcoleus sp. SIO2G3]